jgi:hypothetical protein
MESIVVVTSWWSNCLALTSLHRLVEFAPGREIYVMQAGKTNTQMDRFRQFMPRGVTELHYPPHLLADDSPMREYLAREALHEREGAWFFDHDAFLLTPAAAWLTKVDALLDKSPVCLCTRHPLPGEGVTQPAYWLSPRRWPNGLSSFDPVPFHPKPYALRPDLCRHDGNLTLPDKDTLVKVREELEAMQRVWTLSIGNNRACPSPLPAFPPHTHLGGLHLYTGPIHPPVGIPSAFFEWRRHVVLCFDRFFRACPPEWLAVEDPELLRRHRELFATVYGMPSEKT